MIVARAREPIANSQLRLVPLWLVFFWDLVVLNFFRTFLQLVFDVLKDDVVERAMVNLSELVRPLAIKVNNEASSQVVLNFDHVAGHLDGLTRNQFFGHQSEH